MIQHEHSHSMLALGWPARSGFGKGYLVAAALLETSVSGQRSRCVCFSPRFRFPLDSSFSLSRLRGRMALDRGQRGADNCAARPFVSGASATRLATLLITTSTCASTSIKRACPPVSRIGRPQQHRSPSPSPPPLHVHPNFPIPKGAAPWNWIVQRS